MFIDCLSSCTGFAVAFGLLEGQLMLWLSCILLYWLPRTTVLDRWYSFCFTEPDAQTLALWRTGERKGCQKQKNRPKFLDTDALIYSTLTTDTDKFSSADIRYCSTADKIPKLIVIGVTRNRIYRWEISRSFSSNRWECTDLIDFDVTDFTIQKISLCGTGGILASFDGASGKEISAAILELILRCFYDCNFDSCDRNFWLLWEEVLCVSEGRTAEHSQSVQLFSVHSRICDGPFISFRGSLTYSLREGQNTGKLFSLKFEWQVSSAVSNAPIRWN